MTEQIYEIKNFPPGLFENIAKDYVEHDKTCSSIPHMWLGHKGGVSDMWSQGPCADCDVWFYVDGLKWYEGSDDGEIDEYSLCNCCDKKRQK